MRADFYLARVDFGFDAAQHLPAKRVTVGLDSDHKAETARGDTQLKKIWMDQRLAAGEGQVHHLHLSKIIQKAHVLLRSERRALEARIVVAEEAIMVCNRGKAASVLPSVAGRGSAPLDSGLVPVRKEGTTSHGDRSVL